MKKLHLKYWLAQFLILSIFSICLVSCEEPELIPEDDQPVFAGVDKRLHGFFLSFEAEAARRGFLIDLEELGITGGIMNINSVAVAGRCTFNESHPNQILIDDGFWRNAPDRLKEFIVFHELGHCVLYRDHRDEEDNNGNCVSMMRSGNTSCQENYLPSTRQAYLDELFDIRFYNELKDE